MKKLEKRKPLTKTAGAKPSNLPHDYLRLIEQTLTQALEKGLTEIKKTHPVSEFYADGAIYGDEVLVTITLHHGEKNILATTVYASADYHPGVETPTLETLLGSCVDTAGSVFDYYLDPTSPERIAQIADASLGALEEAPFDWTRSESEFPIWVKIDKSNPRLEEAAEDWLAKNDPHYQAQTEKDLELDAGEAEEFLSERLDAIKKARDGGGGPGGMGGPGSTGGSGPIRH